MEKPILEHPWVHLDLIPQQGKLTMIPMIVLIMTLDLDLGMSQLPQELKMLF